uniref:Telomerase-associated protein 1 n=1 Tax=Astyanax mexicanus TaxID=7994 RepID=A0A3B1IJF7_ASTMX
ENRILAQASSLLPHASALTPSWATPSPSISSCSALQPSWLSSTSTTHPLLSSSISSSSHLLSSTVFSSSSLLSTKNTQLKQDLLSSSLCSPPSTLPLLHSTSLSAAYILLNVVCCSLVNKSSAPNQNDWDSKKNVWTRIKDLGTEITRRDPEFILKVAVYTRQELNIRITTNFLLALAAYLPESKPHLRRYFCAAVQLPSDWLEVTRLFSTCFSSSLPACLKKALVDKFKQFSEYQLAKYNTRKLRGKHNKKKREYPSDLRAFVSSGLSGVWESERAGQRMKLKQPDTWETKLSLEGNNAAVWEKLINNSLPFMAMLRNLRNMITQGISDQHHERILKRLTSKNAVIQSRQFPFRFLSAYKVIME